MGILGKIKDVIVGHVGRARESAREFEEAASRASPLEQYTVGYKEAVSNEPSDTDSMAYHRGYESRMSSLVESDAIRQAEIQKRLDRLERLEQRQREANLQLAEASVEARLRKARDIKRAASSDSLKSRLIRGLAIAPASTQTQRSGRTMSARRASGGKGSRKKAAKSARGGAMRSPITYNPMAYPTTRSGVFMSAYSGGFVDMDIFGRYGDWDLDMFGTPRGGRLFFSSNLFP